MTRHFSAQDIVKRHNDSSDELNLKTPSSNGLGLGGGSSSGPQPHPSWVYRDEFHYGNYPIQGSECDLTYIFAVLTIISLPSLLIQSVQKYIKA